MISDEWWEYHLTNDGWIEGSYKHDFEGLIDKPTPEGSVLTRRYFERLGHPYAKMEIGYDETGGLSEKAIELLKKYPHPQRFIKRFKL